MSFLGRSDAIAKAPLFDLRSRRSLRSDYQSSDGVDITNQKLTSLKIKSLPGRRISKYVDRLRENFHRKSEVNFPLKYKSDSMAAGLNECRSNKDETPQKYGNPKAEKRLPNKSYDQFRSSKLYSASCSNLQDADRDYDEFESSDEEEIYQNDLLSMPTSSSVEDLPNNKQHTSDYSTQSNSTKSVSSNLMVNDNFSRTLAPTMERWLTETESTQPSMQKNRQLLPRDGYFWLVALFIKLGRKLTPQSPKGKSDPYVKIKHRGQVLARSRMIPNNCNPVWDEKFWFVIATVEYALELRVYHRDAFKKDGYIGRALVNLLDLDLNEEQHFVAKLTNEKPNAFNTDPGEIKFSILLSEVEERFVSRQKIKKLKHQLEAETLRNRANNRNQSFTSFYSDKAPSTYTLSMPEPTSSTEKVTSEGSLSFQQAAQPRPHFSTSSRDIMLLERQDSTDDPSEETVSSYGMQEAFEEDWLQMDHCVMAQPTWPSKFYEGTNLEIYVKKIRSNQQEQTKVIDLHTMNNEIQLERYFYQARLIITLIGAKHLGIRRPSKSLTYTEDESSRSPRGTKQKRHRNSDEWEGMEEEYLLQPCPVAYLTVGGKTHRSRVKAHTRNPLWNEEFVFRVRPGLKSVLRGELYDHSHQNPILLGRFYLDFSNLVIDWTTCFTLKNTEENCKGEILILATMTGLHTRPESVNYLPNNLTLRPPAMDLLKQEFIENNSSDKPRVSNPLMRALESHYKLNRTLTDLSDVGWLRIIVHRAHNLPSKDRNGKCDPLCELRLVNRVARTFTVQKSQNPIWNQAFVFPINDLYSVLEVNVLDEGKDDNELLGCVVFPLIKLKNRCQKWYILKDKKLIHRTKGSIFLETTMTYNPVRAALRAVCPKERKLAHVDRRVRLRELAKKQVPLLQRNIDRLAPFAENLKKGSKTIQQLYSWKNPTFSTLALIAFSLFILFVQPYMIAFSLVLVIITLRFIPAKWLSDVKAANTNRTSTIIHLDSDEYELDQLTVHSEEPMDKTSDVDDTDETILRKKREKKINLSEKLGKARFVLGQLQYAIEELASFVERVDSLFHWQVPWLSCLALIVLIILTILTYFIPIRYLILVFGIKRFTCRLRKKQMLHFSFWGIVSRVPSRMEKIYYKELPPTSPQINKSVSQLSTHSKLMGLMVYSKLAAYDAPTE